MIIYLITISKRYIRSIIQHHTMYKRLHQHITCINTFTRGGKPKIPSDDLRLLSVSSYTLRQRYTNFYISYANVTPTAIIDAVPISKHTYSNHYP